MNNKDLRHKFSEDREQEPQGLWDDILAEIDIDAIRKDHSRRKMRPVLIVCSAVASAAAIVLGLFLNTAEIALPQTVQVEQELPSATSIAAVERESNELPTTENAQKEIDTNGQIRVSGNCGKKSGYHEEQGEYHEERTEHHKTQAEHHEGHTKSGSKVKVIENRNETIDIQLEPDDSEEWTATPESPEEIRGNDNGTEKRFSIGLMAGSIANTTATYAGYDGSFSGSDRYSDAAIRLSGYDINPATNIEYKNMEQKVTTDIRYFMPIRSGVTARLTFKQGLGIETGVLYSYLHSATRSGADANFSLTDSIGHYIGIPLYLNYTLWDNGKWSVYINAGVICEWRADGESTTVYYIDNKQFGNTVHLPLAEHRFQCSANASAGIQYRIIPWLSIYAEPTLTYYFTPDSFYSNHPLNFSLSLGIRFDL